MVAHAQQLMSVVNEILVRADFDLGAAFMKVMEELAPTRGGARAAADVANGIFQRRASVASPNGQ
jgi:hypothetical protein